MQDILTCPIGLELYDEREFRPYTLDSCGHTFCHRCIQLFPNKYCPHCRAPFYKINPNFTLIDVISINNQQESVYEPETTPSTSGTTSTISTISNKNYEEKDDYVIINSIDDNFNDLISICNQSKNLVYKNFRESGLEENMNKAVDNINSLADELLYTSKLKCENYDLTLQIMFNKMNLWKDTIVDSINKHQQQTESKQSNGVEQKVSHKDLKYVKKNIENFCQKLSNVVTSSAHLVKDSLSDPVQQEDPSFFSNTLNSLKENVMPFVQSMLLSFEIASSPNKCLGTFTGHSRAVRCIIQFNDKLISGSNDKSIRVWNIRNGNNIKVLDGHKNTVSCLLNESDSRLISGSWDNTIKIWDLRTNLCVCTLNGHSSWVLCLCLTSNGYLISGSADKNIHIWDLENEHLINVLSGHTNWISCLKITPNRKLISGSYDKSIRIWNLETYECEMILNGHDKCVCCLEIVSNDRLMSGSFDRTIKIWNIRQAICLLTFRDEAPVMWLHLLTDDYFVSGNYGGGVKIWSLIGRTCYATIKVNDSNFFNDYRLSSNGDLYTCSDDKTIKKYHILNLN